MSTTTKQTETIADSLDLRLSRPLCVFDLEATGTDVDTDRIIQVGIARIEPGGQADTFDQKIDPKRSVPSEVEALTGITTQELTFAPPLEDVADYMLSYFEGADLAGYNLKSYDLPLLEAELGRIGAELPPPEDREVLDIYEMEKYCRSLSLEAVYERYTGGELEGAHEALADVIGTTEVLSRQVEEFGLPGTVEGIAEEMSDGYLDQKRRLYRDEEGAMRLDFGKFGDQNRSLEWVLKNEPDYLRWMLEEIDDLRGHFTDRLEELGYKAADV